MTRFSPVLAVVLAAAPAAADDEGSEHTAQLVGASSDTLGVILNYDAKTGWAMAVRAKPGADQVTTQLALPNSHAHYVAYVTPGRTSIAFIEVSAGRGPTAKDTVGWVYAPDGTLLRTWTFGAIVDGTELADSRASTSHFSVLRDMNMTSQGITFLTRRGGRIVMLVADATTFR